MRSCIKQLIQTKSDSYLKLTIYLIFLTNLLSIQTALASSELDHQPQHIDVILVDEHQAQSVLNNLNYDHVAIKELTHTEAQALLEHSSQSLNYSSQVDELSNALKGASCGAATFSGVFLISVLVGDKIFSLLSVSNFFLKNFLVLLPAISLSYYAYIGCAGGF